MNRGEKNMKKKLMMLCLVPLLLMAGCQKNEKKVSDKEISSNESISQEIDFTTEYGKVTEINGNEVSLKMGTLKEKDEEEKQSEPIGDEAGTMTEAGQASEGEGLDSQLEYSDKKIDIIVKAGTKVLSMGENVGVKGMKKGSLVAIDKDKDGKILQLTLLD